MARAFAGANASGIAIFDDAIQRADTVGANGTPTITTFQWSANASQIFAANGYSTGADAELLTVNPSGATLQTDVPGVFEFPGHIKLIGTSIYTDSGIVVSEPAFTRIGTFALACTTLCSGAASMVPDATGNRAFFLEQGQIQSFNLTTFAPVASLSLPGLVNNGAKIVRWGTNGLATINFGYAPQYQILLISGPFVTQ